MPSPDVDTICALSTPPGRSALALIRISGPETFEALSRLGAKDLEVARPKLSRLKDRDGSLLDEAVVTQFKGPKSFTGEDMGEIACHGNPAVVEGILNEIVSRETIRFAEPGEFSRRALAHGKLSLSDVEALDTILNSPVLKGAQMGLRSKAGGLIRSLESIREEFVEVKILLEAQLDFSETDTGSVDLKELTRALTKLRDRLKKWEQTFSQNKHLYSSWKIALIGPPNAGKSSLFNALIGHDRAIVHDQPGTTRDYLEQGLRIQGFDLTLIDTAGLRNSADQVESIGIARALESAKGADQVIWIDEQGLPPPEHLLTGISCEKLIQVRSKADLASPENSKSGSFALSPEFLAVSSKDGTGIEGLRNRLGPQTSQVEAIDLSPLISERQVRVVRQACSALELALENLNSGDYLDSVTQRVVESADGLKDLVGSVATEEVLKGIFARFCIGK